MSNLQLPRMSFDNLATMKVPASGKIAHNTWIRRNSDCVEVLYHTTVIAIIYRDRVEISNGDWHTVTTANRLNAITRDNGMGYVNIRQGEMLYTPKGGKVGPDSVMVAGHYRLLVRN
jgi:hypothetical protein